MQTQTTLTLTLNEIHQALTHLIPPSRAKEIETLMMQVALEANTLTPLAAFYTLVCGVAFLSDTSPSLDG